jgi:hypothetical protein
MMHSRAIEVLKDEIERVEGNVLYLNGCLSKLLLTSVMGVKPAIREMSRIRWEHQLVEQQQNLSSLRGSVILLEAMSS